AGVLHRLFDAGWVLVATCGDGGSRNSVGTHRYRRNELTEGEAARQLGESFDSKVSDFIFYGAFAIILLVLVITIILVRNSDNKISNDLNKQDEMWQQVEPEFNQEDHKLLES
ncbi:MAG: hypothetical protein OSA21_04705, partial [Candidatus Poseidoniaceae archaeon]|nr:hypothetical protein [Candidatus Poseidoniaceae archaeon]